MTEWHVGDRVTPRTDGGRRYNHTDEIGVIVRVHAYHVEVQWDDEKEDDWHGGNLLAVKLITLDQLKGVIFSMTDENGLAQELGDAIWKRLE